MYAIRSYYEIVKEAQQLAQDALKPGIPCKDIDTVARNYIKEKGYGEYFAHGLGHGVGLDIHEFVITSYSIHYTKLYEGKLTFRQVLSGSPCLII